MKTKDYLMWIPVFVLLSVVTVYTLTNIRPLGLLNAQAYSGPTHSFYFSNGQELTAKDMKQLLYNSDFELEYGTYSITSFVNGFKLTREEDAYLVSVLGKNDRSNKKCEVLRILREHPEIVAKFPELEDETSHFSFWRIDGINCLHTAGGRGSGLGLASGGVS